MNQDAQVQVEFDAVMANLSERGRLEMDLATAKTTIGILQERNTGLEATNAELRRELAARINDAAALDDTGKA